MCERKLAEGWSKNISICFGVNAYPESLSLCMTAELDIMEGDFRKEEIAFRRRNPLPIYQSIWALLDPQRIDYMGTIKSSCKPAFCLLREIPHTDW